MLTGRYPHNTGAGELHLPLPENQRMVTTPLRSAGYWTAVVGKWHLGEAASKQVDFRKGSNPIQMGSTWVSAIRERPKDKPFFLWAAHSDPHRGYSPTLTESGEGAAVLSGHAIGSPRPSTLLRRSKPV